MNDILNKIYRGYEKNSVLYKIAFVLFCFSIYFIWACVQPFNSCPDESMRYVIPKYIYNNFSLPNANDISIINSHYGFSYANQPMLPYIISAMFMKFVSIFTASDYALIIAARMTSVLAGLGYVIVLINISEIALKKISSKWIFIVLCSMWPQVAFIFTYVNCDGLAMFSAAMVIYSWIHIYNKGINKTGSIIMAIGLSIGLLTYLNTYIFAPISFLFYIYAYFLQNKNDRDIKYFFKCGFLIIGLILLFTGWHFIRNIVLYDGNFFAQGVNNYGELYGEGNFKPSVRSAKAKEMLSTLSGIRSWVNSTAISFIGEFGYMSIPLHKVMYGIYAAEIIFGLGSCGICVIKKKFKIFRIQYLLFYIFALTIIMVITMSFMYSFSDYQPQGRYILPALIPICYFITVGFKKFFDIVPKKFRYLLQIVLILVNIFMLIDSLLIIMKTYIW